MPLTPVSATVLNTSSDVKIAAQLLKSSAGISVDIMPPCSYEEILWLHGLARSSIGLSSGDGITMSIFEAMIIGSFPIPSHTSCAKEWIQEGAMVKPVHPEDPQDVAEVIRIALSDDELVDRAAVQNVDVARERLQYAVIRAAAITYYESVMRGDGSSR